jgi:hypothetical protein
MRPLLLLLLGVSTAFAAEVCPVSPGAAGGPEWRSWSAKVGRSYCVGNQVSGAGKVTWTAAGIASAEVRETLRMQVCCFESEQARNAKLLLGDRELTVLTHQEGDDSRGQDDDFPDLIEEDSHSKSISIRGTLWDGEHPVRVDVLLKCSASKFADRYAFQFTVSDKSPDPIDIDWDHLRRMRAAVAPSVQGATSVFLTPKRPHEALATVELKTKAGRPLGSFQFDGYFW